MTISVKDSEKTQPQAVTGEAPWPNSTYSWYVVSLLMLLYMFSFVDRTIMVLLIEPIKRDLQLSDTHIGLLYGAAFAVFYTLCGIPIARLADRRNRRNIIVIGVTVWSLMTCLCGLSRNFVQLFLARVGVGVGEAALSPAAYSMISDYFPARQRAKAMSLYTMGLYLGAGMAVLAGGMVIGLVEAMPTVSLPIVGELYSWQVTFIVVGLPGLLLALMMFTVREPLRRGIDTSQDQVSLRAALKFFRQRWRLLGFFCVGMAFHTMYSYSLSAWLPSFFIRTHDWDIVRVSQYYGTVLVIFGPGGILAGGWFASYMAQRGDQLANARMLVICFAALLVPAAVMPLLENAYGALAFVAMLKFAAGLPLGVAVAALHEVTPNRLRAQVAAIYLFTINILGLGVGPVLIAVFTDFVFGDEAALRYSLAIVGPIMCVIGLALSWYALGQFRRVKSEGSDSVNAAIAGGV